MCCHPSLRSGSAHRERSFAALRMTGPVLSGKNHYRGTRATLWLPCRKLMLKYCVKCIHSMPLTPGVMPTFLQNDHAEVFQIGSERFLYPLPCVRITVT